jgi:sugar lactone lactonase YvrE
MNTNINFIALAVFATMAIAPTIAESGHNAEGGKSVGSAESSKVSAKPVAVEIVARISQPIGNMTFTPDNRKFFSIHPFFKPDLRVAELTSSTTFKPFPNLDWNTPKPHSDKYLDDVLGIRGDENGVVWILDMGNRNKITPKVVGWNTKKNALEKIYYIPAPASLPSSQLNDLVIDNKNHAIYIADEDVGPGGDGSKGALVVIDMKTGKCRRLLEGSKSTRAEIIPVVVNGKPLRVTNADGSKRLLTIGNDGIAADKNFEWLYYGPMNGHTLYRLKIADVLDTALSEKKLATRVERYSEKTNNGGITLDSAGNIYSTEPETRSIGIVTANTKTYKQYAHEEQCSWPDGLSYSPDGYMYVSDSQIGKSSLCNDGKSLNKAPYLLFRFKPLAPGRVGH